MRRRAPNPRTSSHTRGFIRIQLNILLSVTNPAQRRFRFAVRNMSQRRQTFHSSSTRFLPLWTWGLDVLQIKNSESKYDSSRTHSEEQPKLTGSVFGRTLFKLHFLTFSSFPAELTALVQIYCSRNSSFSLLNLHVTNVWAAESTLSSACITGVHVVMHN